VSESGSFAIPSLAQPSPDRREAAKPRVREKRLVGVPRVIEHKLFGVGELRAVRSTESGSDVVEGDSNGTRHTLQLHREFWLTDISNVLPPLAKQEPKDVPDTTGDAPERITDKNQALTESQERIS
jgi:hypothetical protein